MKKSYIKYFAALLLFGSNGIVASRIAMTSMEIVFGRTLIGSILLIVLYRLSSHTFTFFRKKRSFRFLLASGSAMGTSWVFLYEAYQRIGVSLSSLLYYCGPVIVMALSPLLFRERLTAPRLAGFSLVALGVVLTNGTAGSTPDPFGILCGGMSAVMYAVMVLCNKKCTEIEGSENSTVQLTVSFLTVAVFLLARGDFSLRVPACSLPWLLLLGLVNTGIGCWFYFSSIGRLPVQTVAICGYLEPLSAVILSVLILGERMTLPQIFGAILILGGAVLGERMPVKCRSSCRIS